MITTKIIYPKNETRAFFKMIQINKNLIVKISLKLQIIQPTISDFNFNFKFIVS